MYRTYVERSIEKPIDVTQSIPKLDFHQEERDPQVYLTVLQYAQQHMAHGAKQAYWTIIHHHNTQNDGQNEILIQGAW